MNWTSVVVPYVFNLLKKPVFKNQILVALLHCVFNYLKRNHS